MREIFQRRFRRPKVWVPAALVLLLLAGVALRIASRSGVRHELAAIREAGLPADAAELDRWYKHIPADDNVALAIFEAAYSQRTPASGKNPNEDSLGDFVTHGPLPPKRAEAIEDYVGANVTAIEKLGGAVQLSGSRYPIDLSQGGAIMIPHLATVKNLSTLLKWGAVQSSLEAKPDEAVRRLKTGFGVADSLAPEPLLISELVRIACVSLMLPALERVVNDHQLTLEQAAELDEALRNAEEQGRKSMFRALVGERALGTAYFGMSYKEYEKSTSMAPGGEGPLIAFSKALLFNFRRASGMADRDKAFYLRFMGDWARATRMDYPEMLREYQRLDEYLQAELAMHRSRYLISGMLLPTMAGAAKKEALLAARLRCARMALAIEKFRAVNSGQLPNLAELQQEFLKELPRDPVDGSALEYRLGQERGYSVKAAASTALANEGRTRTNPMAAGFVVAR